MSCPRPACRARVAYASPLLLEAGVAGLVWAFLARRGHLWAAAVSVAGLAAFVSRVAWMLGHRRPPPTERRRPDWSTAHVLESVAWLLFASGLGLYLAAAEASGTTVALASAYGVAGLVGFLSQIVVGLEGRILPLFAWLWGFADRAYDEMPPSLHAAPVHPLQALVFFLWTAGVPALGYGLAADRPTRRLGGGAARRGARRPGQHDRVLRRLWAPARRSARLESRCEWKGPPTSRDLLRPQPAGERRPATLHRGWRRMGMSCLGRGHPLRLRALVARPPASPSTPRRHHRPSAASRASCTRSSTPRRGPELARPLGIDLAPVPVELDDLGPDHGT